MTVRKHMTKPAIAISDDTDFKTAMGLMQKHRIRRLPVVDAHGMLSGIVAERDLLVAADRYLSSPVDVGRIMTRRVVTVGETTPVATAADLMIERKIGGLPVVDASQRLLGIITETDLLKALAERLRATEAKARKSRQSRAKEPLKRRKRTTSPKRKTAAKKR
jgi:acetoin utilization protein AcuB